jgi:hypothetical protein
VLLSELSKKGGLAQYQRQVNITLLADTCDVNFFSWNEVQYLHCMPACFPVGSKW